MNYLGSKIRLSAFIYNTIVETVEEDISDFVFCDLFAGTGVIGKLFHGKVKRIISNDREYFSYVINRSLLNGKINSKIIGFIANLNKLKGYPGFIFTEYSEGGKAGRLYFSKENGQKIDAIRLEIECWYTTGVINENQYLYLLASLLISIDKVANTTAIYGAYLKFLKSTAKKELRIISLETPKGLSSINEIYNEDSNRLIQKINGDILYLDPPYNGREYAANYHLLNTIALYDKFVPCGVTGLRPYQTSRYCMKSETENALWELLQKANFKYIFLSYNNDGIISNDTIEKMMRQLGEYKVAKKSYRRFKSQKAGNSNKTTTEFIHILIK